MKPADPPASVARVQQAEAEFTAAQAGITDETPLAQAAEQFNSAAVALEMAWLALFVDADCLTDENQGQAADAVADYTRALQRDLADAGFFDEEVDGVYGPETVAAVRGPAEGQRPPADRDPGQGDRGSPGRRARRRGRCDRPAGDGIDRGGPADPGTRRVLGRPRGRCLERELTEALEALQSDLGVPVTGTVDAATIAALEALIAGAEQRPSEGPAATPEPTDSEPSPASS